MVASYTNNTWHIYSDAKEIMLRQHLVNRSKNNSFKIKYLNIVKMLF